MSLIVDTYSQGSSAETVPIAVSPASGMLRWREFVFFSPRRDERIVFHTRSQELHAEAHAHHARDRVSFTISLSNLVPIGR